MAIKSDRWIKTMAAQGMIDPFVPNQLRQLETHGRLLSYGTSSYGYDLRCEPTFSFIDDHTLSMIDPKNFDQSRLKTITANSYEIPANATVRITSTESFCIPPNIIAWCVGKSTYARCCVVVNSIVLPPGWKGQLTLLLANTAPIPVKIYANEGIAQIIFAEVATETLDSIK
jgi:dCTP deaminase